MLRIINAALNDDLFFKLAGHKLTVVEVDAVYTKPYKTDILLITPGQTTNVLVTADQSAGRYLLSVSPFMDAPLQVDNKTGTAILNYANTISATARLTFAKPPPQNATPIASKFVESLRSLNSKEYPANVPQTVEHSLFLTIGVGVNPCRNCINVTRVVGAINNLTFVMPSTPILQANYYNIPGVFTEDFPATPPHKFNYTGSGPKNLQTMNGTRVYRLPYNASVQVLLQDTGILSTESHPIHLHGFNFFVVGRGVGNYNPKTSPLTFNLIDPVERNTIGVPTGGWAAIRFRADNPGIYVNATLLKVVTPLFFVPNTSCLICCYIPGDWFMHCHFEVHTSWGLKMVFVVDNGKGPSETLIPPPKDLPQC
jgi:laccase